MRLVSKYLVEASGVVAAADALNQAGFDAGTEDIAIVRGGIEYTYLIVSRFYSVRAPDLEDDYRRSIESVLTRNRLDFRLLC